MIKEELIKEIVLSKIEGTGVFFVSLKIKGGSKIFVEIDHHDNLAIDKCVAVSRAIEGELDRDEEDFELQVSSPGLSEPFKVVEQYKKYIDRNVDVLLKDSTKVTGKLLSVSDTGISIETKASEQVEGKKKKQVVIKELGYSFEDIKETKVVISFK